MQDRQKGSFYGLGILVTKRNDQVTVITPLEGTPAARLGIRAGDVISEVEGVSTEDLPLDDVVKRLKGPKGTTVHIKIMRVGMKEPIPLTIVRAAIPTNSISNVLMLRPGIGYIRIKDFTATTVRELDEAIDKLKGQGMQKLVLDLRQNPGGLLDAAVGVSDHFLDKGQMIVYTKGRTPDSAQDYLAPGKHQQLDMPMVVVVNRGSASASEIVAGAIQDHDRGHRRRRDELGQRPRAERLHAAVRRRPRADDLEVLHAVGPQHPARLQLVLRLLRRRRER